MEWISVKDRLPEQGVYIVFIPDMDNEEDDDISMEYYDSSETKWYDNQRCEDVYNVTHWMHLPEPPKN